MSFVSVEQPAFLNFVKNLRPGYIPPERRTLSGNLLDKVYNEIKSSLKGELDDTECSLVQDGWSNVSNTPVIASSIHFNGNCKTSILQKLVFCNRHLRAKHAEDESDSDSEI